MVNRVPPDAGPLPLEVVATDTRLIRIHRSTLAPLFFGSLGFNRFDDPQRHL